MRIKNLLYEKDKNIFSQKLKKLLEEHKETQKSLSDYITEVTGESITRQSVGQWCLGNTYPSLKIVPIIAEFFDVSTDYLLTDTDIETNEITTVAVCQYTGLSQTSVNVISTFNAASLYTDLLNAKAITIAKNNDTKEEITKAALNCVRSIYNATDGHIEADASELVEIVANIKSGKPIKIAPIKIINFFIENGLFEKMFTAVSAYSSDITIDKKGAQVDNDFFVWKLQKEIVEILENMFDLVKEDAYSYLNNSGGDPNAHHNPPQE